MKQIKAMKLEQKGKNFFFFVADPRDIIAEVQIADKDKVQEFQRPWTEKRVKDISKYVAGKEPLKKGSQKTARGFLPTVPILNLKADGHIKIEEKNGEYYLLFPEDNNEKKECLGDIEILDGQHRLISFTSKYRDADFKDSERYNMGFIAFQKLTRDEKGELFIVTNERVEKVDRNVLQNMMEWLGVLSDDDRKIYNLIRQLNKEDISPLKGRIRIEGEKLVNGLKLLQVQRVLRKSKVYDMLRDFDVKKQVKVISNYLRAWEDVFDIKFNNRRKPKTLERILGLQYILCLYPCIYNILNNRKEKLTEDNVKNIVNNIKIVILDKLSNDNNAKKAFFGSDSGVTGFAKKTSDEIDKYYKEIDGNTFDPLADV